MQLAYGLCISPQDPKEELHNSENYRYLQNEECEMTDEEVAQFFYLVKASFSNDTSTIRPPFSNPYRAEEYAKGETW